MENLPELGYEYDSLEPYIDKETMTIHHDKHHAAYVKNFNAAAEGIDKGAENLIKDLNQVPEEKRTAIKNNGGGVINHSFFWTILKKDVEFKGAVAYAINSKFGSFEKFKEEFSKAAITRFGSGWAWLVLNNRELEIMSTANQDSPLSEGKIPLLCIDVWEHAYYLKYQNKRNEYVENFFKVINWDKVNENFEKSK